MRHCNSDLRYDYYFNRILLLLIIILLLIILILILSSSSLLVVLDAGWGMGDGGWRMRGEHPGAQARRRMGDGG